MEKNTIKILNVTKLLSDITCISKTRVNQINLKAYKSWFFCFIFILLNFSVVAQTTYYSSGGTTANTLTNWKTNPDGTGTSPLNFSGNGDVFILQLDDSYTATSGFNIPNGTLEVYGTLTCSATNTFKILTVRNRGIFTANAQTTIPSNGEFNIEGTGKYILNNSTTLTSTKLFGGTENFEPSSSFELRNFEATEGAFGACMLNCTGSFPNNVIWNITSGSTAYILNKTANATRTINGNLIIQQTGSNNSGSVAACGNVVSPHFVVNGLINITGGKFYLGASNIASQSPTLTLGDFTIGNGTTFDISPGGSPSTPTLNLKGNITNTGTGIFKSSQRTPIINFTGNGNEQVYNNSSSGFNNVNLNIWNINSTAVVRLASNIILSSTVANTFTVNGSLAFGTGSSAGLNDFYISMLYSNSSNVFTLNAGSTIRITSVDGIQYSSTLGNIRTSGSASRYSLSSAANYRYIGDASQITGNALPNNISGRLISNNTSGTPTGVTLSQATEISGSGTFQLIQGIFTTTTTNLLTISNSSYDAVSGGSSNSFVNGPLKRLLLNTPVFEDSSYYFPVGKSGNYLPFYINSYASATNQSPTVEAFVNNSAGTFEGGCVSISEYWKTIYSDNDFSDPFVALGKSQIITTGSLVGVADDSNGFYTSSGGVIEVPNPYYTVSATDPGENSLTNLTRYYAIISDNTNAEGGTIAEGGAQTICENTNPVSITLTGNAGSVIRWEQSTTPDFSDAVVEIPYSGLLTTLSTDNVFVNPIYETTYYRAVVQYGVCTGGNSLAYSEIASITVPLATEWDGNAWSQGEPTETKRAIFTSDYTATADMFLCSITISNNAVVTIPSGIDCIVSNDIQVDEGSSFVFENTANLLQINKDAINSGNIKMIRNTNPLYRLDYTAWSSPVVGQNLLSFSPNTLSNRFYTYNTSENLFYPIDPSGTNFEQGKGYLIRTPNNHSSSTATIWNGVFEGVPNNGDIFTFLENYGEGSQGNIVGNPYPSPISMRFFVDANIDNITGALYFWRKTNSTITTSWSTWNNGVYVAADEPYANNPNGIIRNGQGFFVTAKNSSTSLVFDNSMRVSDNSDLFFRTAANNENSNNTINENSTIWLNLTNSEGKFYQQAISYSDYATDALDRFDAKNLSNAPAMLNSVIPNSNDYYVIQSRALPISDSDVIPLSLTIGTSGEYTISIFNKDGLFSDSSRAIYLTDYYLNTCVNLNDGLYTFTSAPGSFNNRFQLGFTNVVLSNNDNTFLDNDVNIFINENNQLIVNSNRLLYSISVYDILGKLLLNQDVNDSNNVIVDLSALSNQILLVKITDANGMVLTKKIIK